MNKKPKLQEDILKAGNIGYGRFRIVYKQLKEYYQKHPEKLQKLRNI